MDPDSPDLRRCVMLDSLASRYHLLPSQVLASADALDLQVFDVAVSYERWAREQAEARAAGRPPAAAPMSVNTMQERLRQVREK